jgi:ATP-dependent Clp protease, protease subunit
MAAETWFDAKDALDLGLATRTIEPVRIAASFDVARLRNAPPGLAEAIEAGGLVLDAESPMRDEDPVGAEPEILAEDKSFDPAQAGDPGVPGPDGNLEPSEDAAPLSGGMQGMLATPTSLRARRRQL